MKLWLTVLVLALLCGTIWLAFHQRHGKPPNPKPLSFLFTCDVRGRLVPCGCFSGQLGGLTRIATLFGKGNTPDSIKLDVGDALASAADYDVIEYRHLQHAFAVIGYEALNIGHREAQLGIAQLRALKAAATVTMLSANLLDKTTREPVFEPWKIVQRGGCRIALIGVLDPHGIGDALGEGLAVEPMEVALGKLMPKLRSQADFCVLLAFADEEALDSVARQFYEFDAILGGKVRQPSQQLLRENRSLILATTNESRAVGILQTRLLGKNRLEPVRGEVELVSERIPQDEEIRAFAQAYRDEVRHAKLAVDDPAKLQEDMVPGVKEAASYTGSQTCAGCHAAAWKTWSGSAHSRAFATLKEAGADADPNCIRCHTVGFGTPSGYLRAYGDGKLVDVGCESCHGPGSQHVEQRRKNAETAIVEANLPGEAVLPGSGKPAPKKTTDGIVRLRPVGESDCTKCHHGEFSRPFVWGQFWPAIVHGK